MTDYFEDWYEGLSKKQQEDLLYIKLMYPEWYHKQSLSAKQCDYEYDKVLYTMWVNYIMDI